MVDERKAGDEGGRQRTADRRAGDFGSKLREARERKGISLREIANATKISVRALEALERNDISHLPGGIFSRSFVRAYAAEAGLNPDETVDDFVRQFPHDTVIAGHASSTSGIDNSDDESNRRTARVVLRLVLLSVPVAAVVLYFGLTNRRVSPVDARPTAARTVQTDVQLAAQPGVQLGVVVTARRACVVTATVDGRPSTELRLEPGGQQTFDARAELRLTVSDPSAIDITINGLAGRALGAAGVSTTIRLTPDNYRDFVAAQ